MSSYANMYKKTILENFRSFRPTCEYENFVNKNTCALTSHHRNEIVRHLFWM